MTTYETSAVVQEQGRILLVGVPFAPGTHVEVTVSPTPSTAPPVAPGVDRAARLLAALDTARNVTPIGAFDREELYANRKQ